MCNGPLTASLKIGQPTTDSDVFNFFWYSYTLTIHHRLFNNTICDKIGENYTEVSYDK